MQINLTKQHLCIKTATKLGFLLIIPMLLSMQCSYNLPSFYSRPNTFTIYQAIAPHTKMRVQLEDKSGFNTDLRNSSKEMLHVQRNQADELLLSPKSSISSVAIASNDALNIVNRSDKNVNVSVRVYNDNHKKVNVEYLPLH